MVKGESVGKGGDRKSGVKYGIYGYRVYIRGEYKTGKKVDKV